MLGEEPGDRAERDPRRLGHGEPVRPGRDGGKRDRARALPDPDLEAPPIRARELRRLAVPAVAMDRPYGVDHPARAEPTAARDLRVAGGAAAERLALLQDRRPAGAVDRAVDAATTEKRRVRRVDDRVGVLLR